MVSRLPSNLSECKLSAFSFLSVPGSRPSARVHPDWIKIGKIDVCIRDGMPGY